MEDANASFGALSAILMVLALAFLTMGAMDYYANDMVEDKEYEAEMRKRSKMGLLGTDNGDQHIEDSCPVDYENISLPDDENISSAWPRRAPHDPMGEHDL